jgi:ketosteroid isomerase-like protein
MSSTVEYTGPSGSQNAAVARRFFDLLTRKDVESWGELWHPDGAILVPYPPEGFPPRIEGKSAILGGFRSLFGNFESFEAHITGVYPAADSDAVCVEYRARAVIVGGTEYTNENIAVFRFRDGLISEYHDYFDPRRFQTVVDALPATGS